jgi:nucleoside phosphorylase
MQTMLHNDTPARPDRVDLAIITALSEELVPVLELIGGPSQWKQFEIDGFIHYYAPMALGDRSFQVIACALWEFGGVPTATAVIRIKSLRPRLIAMTGICAGWQAKDIQLGDVIVADRAFQVGIGKQAGSSFVPDTRTYQSPPWLLQLLKDFARDQNWASTIATPRPRSLRYQSEWLLCQVAKRGPVFPSTQADWRLIRQHCVDYAQARSFLQSQGLLDSLNQLTEQANNRLGTLRERHDGKLAPDLDRAHSMIHYNAFASTEAVVAVEEPFKEPAQRVRNVGAIELEVASLFAAAAEIGVPALAVKGVSDYGTPTKDDRFHVYAAEASARWLYAFLCNYAVELDRNLPKNLSPDPPPPPPPAIHLHIDIYIYNQALNIRRVLSVQPNLSGRQLDAQVRTALELKDSVSVLGGNVGMRFEYILLHQGSPIPEHSKLSEVGVMSNSDLELQITMVPFAPDQPSQPLVLRGPSLPVGGLPPRLAEQLLIQAFGHLLT